MVQRWVGFAQAVRARHARIARRHHPSAMTLARPRTGRVVSNTVQVHPTVSVLVRMPGERVGTPAPVVRNTVTTNTIRQHTSQTIRPDVVYRERMLLASRPDGRGSTVEVRKLTPSGPPAAPRPLLAPLPPRWEKQWVRQVVAQGVLERTRRAEEFVRRLRSATPAAQQAASAAQQVIRKTARHEARTQAAPMQLRPASPAPTSQARTAIETDRSPAVPEPRTPQPAAAPPINIDALTTQVMDQIDRRVISWRERMGRF
jgi:hypothetical protein